MIELISYSKDFRSTDRKTIINDNEYIKMVTEVIRAKDNIITFNIRLNQDDHITSWYNPVIEFGILESRYNYKKSTIENYDNLLFDYVRNIFRNEVF